MNEKKFGVCLNCIDGRLQVPVIEWIQKNYDINYVDMVTEPGMIERISKSNEDPLDDIVKKINHSLKNNQSKTIFITGYGDVPQRLTEQECGIDDVVCSMNRIKPLFPECKIVGLWVNDQWEIELVQDSVNEN